jgi:hypothetical protein
MTFASDIDLLQWEPNIMSDAAGAAQTLVSGSGNLVDKVFTITSGGSLLEARVTDDHVIVLSGAISGSYAVFNVNGSAALTISVLYDQLDVAGPEEASPWVQGQANGLNFVIRTFWPQRKSVSERLLQAAGITPGSAGMIVNPQVLRRPCALGTLQVIFSALASASESPASLTARAELYEKLYRRSLRGVVVEIDRNGDGVVDLKRPLGIVQLRRI